MSNNKVANGKWRMVNGGNKLLAISYKPNAFSVLEIILAMGLFAVIISGAVGVVIQAFSSTRLGEEVTKATFLATEGLEAVRAIQERDFWSLVGTGLDKTYGLDKTTGIWKFSGTQDTFGKYTRKIAIYNVYRDGNDIVPEGEGTTLDLYTKRVEAVVTWKFGPTRSNEVSLPTYFTYWESVLCDWGEIEEEDDVVVTTRDLPGDGSGDGDGTGVQVVGNRAYVTTMKNPGTSGEFFILDISDLTVEPIPILGSLSVGAHVNDLAVSGNYAYLATAKDGEELIVVDISNPSNMETKSIDISGTKTKSANDVSVEGGYAYVVTPKSEGYPELQIYNVAKPLDPKLVGPGFEVDSHVYGVKATKDKRVYLATSRVDKELIIVDVSNPQEPKSCDDCHYDALSTGANGQAVDVIRGGIAYLVTRNNTGDIPEFYLLAIADPENISLVGSFDVGGRANGVAAGVGFALLATEKNDEEFMILNLKDPSNPEKVFSRNLNGTAGGVALLEDKCVAFYVTADDNAEFQVVQPAVQP